MLIYEQPAIRECDTHRLWRCGQERRWGGGLSANHILDQEAVESDSGGPIMCWDRGLHFSAGLQLLAGTDG